MLPVYAFNRVSHTAKPLLRGNRPANGQWPLDEAGRLIEVKLLWKNSHLDSEY